MSLFNSVPNNKFFKFSDFSKLKELTDDSFKFENVWKFSKWYKTLWVKEKLLVASNFSFFHNVFKRIVLQTRKNKGLFRKGWRKRSHDMKGNCLQHTDWGLRTWPEIVIRIYTYYATVLKILLFTKPFLSFYPLLNMPILGFSSKIWTNGDTIIWLSRKHFGKRRNCSLWAISPFPTMFSKAVCCLCVKMSICGVKSYRFLKKRL